MGAKRKRGLPRNRLIQARLERGLAHRERAVEELNRFAATLRTTAPAGSILATLSTELEANTLGRWERGEVNPTPLNIELLCRFHNKSPAELDLLEALEHFQAAGWNFDPPPRVAPQRGHPPLLVSSAADRTGTDETQDAGEPAGDAVVGEDGLTAPVRASQEEWRLVRRPLGRVGCRPSRSTSTRSTSSGSRVLNRSLSTAPNPKRNFFAHCAAPASATTDTRRRSAISTLRHCSKTAPAIDSWGCHGPRQAVGNSASAWPTTSTSWTFLRRSATNSPPPGCTHAGRDAMPGRSLGTGYRFGPCWTIRSTWLDARSSRRSRP